MKLTTPLERIKGVGPKTAQALSAAGLETVADALDFLPRAYDDYSAAVNIADIQPGKVTVRAHCESVSTRIVRRGLRITTAVLADDSGKVKAVWFNQPYRESQLKSDAEFMFSGQFGMQYNSYQISNPSVELAKSTDISDAQPTSGIHPVYKSIKNLRTKTVQDLLKNLRPIMEFLPETLPEHIVQRQKLVSRAEAVRFLHAPKNHQEIARGRERLAFEELFEMILAAQFNKQEQTKLTGWRIPFNQSVVKQFVEQLPFPLTNAQRRAAWQILQDLESEHPMNRLLQGDVGSGKTLVALMSMLIAVDNGFQACLMAPTEILAEQHLVTIRQMLAGSSVRAELLTGIIKGKQRQTLLSDLVAGEIHILVGTHALIEDSVQFSRLGLAVIDEQHRFGVKQRAKLWEKSSTPPHVLVMTATPIPRTLAMTLYGDLDVSIIDELPPGRKPIQTLHKYDHQTTSLYAGIRQQIAQGRQVYIVYPLIKESEKSDLKNLEEGYEALKPIFPGMRMSKIHGKMKAKEKEAEMQRFVAGETQILVATTVIEVGVNVPNASVMVILDAQRFGLSQLHQLRGRVGRGADQSYCILVTGRQLSAETRKRIDIMCETNDGFCIAEADLKLRGPGDLEGTQQSGIAFDLKIADIARDGHLVQLARDEARKVVEADPDCNRPENAILWNRLKQLRRDHIDWAAIS